MNLNRIFLAISLYLCVFFNLSSSAADWSHAEISLIKGDQYHDNSNEKDIKKTIITLQYASGYKYGQNFFFIDAIKADANDNRHGEIYGEYYHTISLAKIKGYDWSKDLIRDLASKEELIMALKTVLSGESRSLFSGTFDRLECTRIFLLKSKHSCLCRQQHLQWLWSWILLRFSFNHLYHCSKLESSPFSW